MPYFLMQMVIGSPGKIVLSEREYQQTVRACENLAQIVSLEEKFDILLGNFVELETDLLAAAARDVVYRDSMLTKRVERNFTINRRFLNLLAASRAYLDQGTHDLKEIVEIDNGTYAGFHTAFQNHTKEQYAQCLGYRIMTEIRNYTQHRGFPIRTRYDRSWVRTENGPSMAYCLTPEIDVEQLRVDSKFKRKILAEVDREGIVEAMPFVRSYIEGLGCIHTKIREEIQELIVQTESIIQERISRYTVEFGPSSRLALAAVEVDDSERVEDEVYLLYNNIEYRQMLSKKNSHFEKLALCFVSGCRLPTELPPLKEGETAVQSR